MVGRPFPLLRPSEGNIFIRMQLSYTIVTLNIFFFGYPFPQYPVWLPLSAFVTLLLNILQWNCFLNFSLPCMQNILFGHPFLILLPSSNIVNISFVHGGQMGYFLFFYPRRRLPDPVLRDRVDGQWHRLREAAHWQRPWATNWRKQLLISCTLQEHSMTENWQNNGPFYLFS